MYVIRNKHTQRYVTRSKWTYDENLEKARIFPTKSCGGYLKQMFFEPTDYEILPVEIKLKYDN